MPLVDWKEDTLQHLARHAGPMAVDIFRRCRDRTRIPDRAMTPANYFRFLRSLKDELPGDIDRRLLLAQLKRNALGRVYEPDRPLPGWESQAISVLGRIPDSGVAQAMTAALDELDRQQIPRATIAGFLTFLEALAPRLPTHIDADLVVSRLKRGVLST